MGIICKQDEPKKLRLNQFNAVLILTCSFQTVILGPDVFEFFENMYSLIPS